MKFLNCMVDEPPRPQAFSAVAASMDSTNPKLTKGHLPNVA